MLNTDECAVNGIIIVCLNHSFSSVFPLKTAELFFSASLLSILQPTATCVIVTAPILLNRHTFNLQVTKMANVSPSARSSRWAWWGTRGVHAYPNHSCTYIPCKVITTCVHPWHWLMGHSCDAKISFSIVWIITYNFTSIHSGQQQLASVIIQITVLSFPTTFYLIKFCPPHKKKKKKLYFR